MINPRNGRLLAAASGVLAFPAMFLLNRSIYYCCYKITGSTGIPFWAISGALCRRPHAPVAVTGPLILYPLFKIAIILLSAWYCRRYAGNMVSLFLASIAGGSFMVLPLQLLCTRWPFIFTDVLFSEHVLYVLSERLFGHLIVVPGLIGGASLVIHYLVFRSKGGGLLQLYILALGFFAIATICASALAEYLISI